MRLEQLIKSCIKKDRKAQETLYKTYKAKLFPVCLKYCSSYTEAQDHLHDTFILIFDNIKKYKNKGSFEGWMKRIAINKAIDNYKKKNTFELTDFRKESLSSDISLSDEELSISFELLMSFIQDLPNQYRMVFSLYQLDGFSHKEIAVMLDINENTSKSNLHRAKSILKEKITTHNQGSIKIKRSHGS